MNDRLGDLRTNAADNAVRPHETRRRDGLHEMLCHQRVDRRHSGDVDDRDPAPVSTTRCSKFSMTTCVLALSSVPISGSASTSSHSWTTGVDNSMSSCCCRLITPSRLS